MKLKLPPREQILNYLLSFNLFEKKGRAEEGITYASLHLDRLLKTIEVIPRIDGLVRVLELGANPFFMTILIQKYLGYTITPANFFCDYGELPDAEDSVIITSTRFNESYTFQYRMFNVERDIFPYEDGAFDIVLCCRSWST